MKISVVCLGMAKNMDRRKFVGTLTTAGALSIIGTGVGTFLTHEFNNEEKQNPRIAELEAKNQDLESSIAEIEEKYANLSSYLMAGESSLDFAKYEHYNRLKEFEPYLDKAIEKYSKIFPVSKLMMVVIAEMESSLGRNKFSKAGAGWLWQFIPETARREGLYVEKNEDYEKARAYRETLRKSNSDLKNLEKELSNFVYNASTGKEFENVKDFKKYLGEKGENQLSKYNTILEKLENARIVYSTNRNKQGKLLSRYLAHLKKIDSLPYEEKIKKDERADNEKATYAAVKFMAGLLKRAKGNYFRALSMYNADDTRVEIMPYSETITHIDKILNRYLYLKGKLINDKYSDIIKQNTSTFGFTKP